MGSTVCPIVPVTEFQRMVALLRAVKTIAVVGMSPNPDRPSNEVGFFLRDHGYSIFPVNPGNPQIPGLTVAKNLTEASRLSGGIDLVDLFVAGERIPPIIEEAKALGIKRVWFQPGADNPAAEQAALDAGMEVVARACTMAILMRAG